MVGLLLLNNSIAHVHIAVKCAILSTLYDLRWIALHSTDVSKKEVSNSGLENLVIY